MTHFVSRRFMVAGLTLAFLLTATVPLIAMVLPARPALASALAGNPPPGFHLMWVNRVSFRAGWLAAPGARHYSYRLYQLNGVRVRAGREPGRYHTVTYHGLHPGWRYRAIVWAGPAHRGGRHATLYVTVPRRRLTRERAYRWAETRAGARYRWGGDGDGSYDCSGLVQAAYARAGIRLPRSTTGMLRSRKLVRVSAPRQGDLAFFGTGHVELYDRWGTSFGAQSGPEDGHRGVWWYRWYRGNWWPTAFYRVV